MPFIKADTDAEQKHFNFLERLRASGITNMRAAPFLHKAFPNDFPEDAEPCRAVVGKWMRLQGDPSRHMSDSEALATLRKDAGQQLIDDDKEKIA